MSTTATTYLTCAETAKLMRPALKRAFPGVKFSVRSDTYAGGASIRVGWTDGPTTQDVDRVAGMYAGATFDGMIDLKSYHTSLLRDENGDAQPVHFGADFVFTDRDISDEWTTEILDEFERIIGRPIVREGWDMWRQQVPLKVDRLDGRLHHMVESETEDLSSVFHQYAGFRAR